MRKIPFQVKAGTTIYASTGRFGLNQPDRMSSEQFYLADAGSRIRLLDKTYFFNVATYTLEFDARYLHTYDYAPEESWTTYAQDLDGDTYRQEDYVFEDCRYFRICLKRVDGRAFTVAEAQRINDILEYCSNAQPDTQRAVFQPEVIRAAQEVQKLREQDDLVFAVLTDTHRTVNGTWAATAANLQAVQQAVGLDAVLHLGDLTDGIVSRELTMYYVQAMLRDMQQTGVPVHVVLGNHDANYFQGNPDVMPLDEQVRLYQKQSEDSKQEKALPYYFIDYPEKRLRIILLSAYENDAEPRYGFDLPQIDWLQKVLCQTPAGYKLLLFAHDAPLAELDFWSEVIRNGDRLMQVLEAHQQKQGNILGYIHGHTHADAVCCKHAFPIISIGCAKCEDMMEKKPPESLTEKRRLGTISQELWDILLV